MASARLTLFHIHTIWVHNTDPFHPVNKSKTRRFINSIGAWFTVHGYTHSSDKPHPVIKSIGYPIVLPIYGRFCDRYKELLQGQVAFLGNFSSGCKLVSFTNKLLLLRKAINCICLHHVKQGLCKILLVYPSVISNT